MLLLLLAAALSAPFDASLDVVPGQYVTVRNANGTVRVSDGDRFHVHAERHAQRDDPSAVKVRVDRAGGGVIVCVRYPSQRDVPCSDASAGPVRDSDVVVDFDVTVPRGTHLDVTSVNGAVTVAHAGDVTAGTANGSVDVDAAAIRSATTANGALRLHVRGPERGTLIARAVNGSIDLTVPTADGMTISARTVNGAIDVPGVATQQRLGSGATADGTIGDGSLKVTLTTVNGAISVRRAVR